MDDKSKLKLKTMSEFYPDIKVIVIGAKEYKIISNKYSKIIDNWEINGTKYKKSKSKA